MAEEIELLEVKDNPVEEGARIDADSAEDVVIDLSLLSSMEEKLVSTSRTEPSPFTICRVPANIRECDHAAYDPKIVSIGPFHRGRENLQAMEEHKWRYLHKVLAFGNGRNNLEKFLKEMKAIEMQARNCYSNIQLSSNEFLEMMVLDSCFLIFLFLQHIHLVEIDLLIYGNYWLSRLIKLDMLLLENQLPFFVLECLWELIGQPKDTLWKTALDSFPLFSHVHELKNPKEHVHHLLHLLHLSLKPVSSLRAPSQQSLPKSKHESPQQWMIPSATELTDAGVRFQLKQARSIFEVSFKQGLMEMSRLWIGDFTNILFRNFIALEQCFPYLDNHCTTYCFFIDFLVNTPRDVSILGQSGIIESALGSDNEVALLINKLCKEIVWSFDYNYLADLYVEVNQHTRKRWTKWRAKWLIWRTKLVRTYFDSPWTIISLIGAVILLVLTFLQTYFSVFAYFKPPKP